MFREAAEQVSEDLERAMRDVEPAT
jgi:hypothetical protein